MANIRTLKLNLLADVSGFNKELEVAQGKMKKFGDKVEKASRVAMVAFGLFAAGGKIAVDAASDLNEEVSKTGAIFGDGAKEIVEFSNTAAKSLGLSSTAALNAAGTFAILGRLGNVTGQDLNDFAMDLTTLSSDLASFNNTSTDEAITALGAGLRGESEPLRRFGILISAAALEEAAFNYEMETGIALERDKKNQLTESSKVLARYQLIMEQTTIQQGDFGRTSDGVANAQRILTAEMTNAKAAIGQGLVPVYSQLLKLVTPLVAIFSANSEVMSKVILAVLGLSAGLIALNYGIKTAKNLQILYNAVLAANPIGLLVIALALLAAGLVIAYNKFEPFKNLVDDVFEIMKKLGAFIVNTLVGQFQRFLDVIDKVAGGVKAIANSAIGKAVGGIFGGGRLPGMATGGSVMGGQAVRVGEFGSEIFVPSGSGSIRPGGGGGGNTFILNGIVDAQSARRTIEKLLQDSARRTGAVSLVGATL